MVVVFRFALLSKVEGREKQAARNQKENKTRNLSSLKVEGLPEGRRIAIYMTEQPVCWGAWGLAMTVQPVCWGAWGLAMTEQPVCSGLLGLDMTEQPVCWGAWGAAWVVFLVVEGILVVGVGWVLKDVEDCEWKVKMLNLKMLGSVCVRVVRREGGRVSGWRVTVFM